MAFLGRALAAAPLRRIWRQAFESLQDLLWNELLMNQDFTTTGAARFLGDLAAMQITITSDSMPAQGSLFSMPKLAEGAKLLNLPLEVAEDGKGAKVSLKDANVRMFASSQEAAKVLEELGLDQLSIADARHVLARRVEGTD